MSGRGALLRGRCRPAARATRGALLALAAAAPLVARSPSGGMANPPAPPAQLGDSVAALLRVRLAGPAQAPVAAAGAQLSSAAEVRRFYARRDYALAWTRPDGLAAAATQLEQALAAAPAEGLTGHADVTAALAALRGRFRGRTWPASARADAELLLSDAFLTYGGELLVGRVDPRRIHPGWTLPARTADLAAVLERALDDGRIGEALEALAPRSPEYVALRTELRRYRGIVLGGGWGALPPPARTLRSGDTGDAVAALRRRLAFEVSVPAAPADTFDAALAAAVATYQKRRGLEADGVVGPTTRRALDVPAAQRLEQLRLALERLRWLPESLGDRYVEVDIPAFELKVMENGRRVLTMRIVGGKPASPTPVFGAQMTSLVLSPYWNVPPGIAAREVWPRVERDPGYLARHHMSVLPDGSIRQAPGPWNALGAVKFLFPNRYDVYLHDTPEKQLFAEQVRAFSHGCMRVERPMDLAAYLLRELPDWTSDRVAAVVAARSEVTIPLTAPLPVYVLYRTAWVDSVGVLQLRDDLYGHDRRLAAALAGAGTAAGAVTAGGECGLAE